MRYNIVIGTDPGISGYVKLYVNDQLVEQYSANGNKRYGGLNVLPNLYGNSVVDYNDVPTSSLQAADRYVILDSNGEAKFKVETYASQTTPGQPSTSAVIAGAAVMLETDPTTDKDFIGVAVSGGKD